MTEQETTIPETDEAVERNVGTVHLLGVDWTGDLDKLVPIEVAYRAVLIGYALGVGIEDPTLDNDTIGSLLMYATSDRYIYRHRSGVTYFDIIEAAFSRKEQ